jgi:hypothetical protein
VDSAIKTVLMVLAAVAVVDVAGRCASISTRHPDMSAWHSSTVPAISNP